MTRLDDRIAIITGGGAGIGREMATMFADRGAIVAVVDRDGAAARATVEAIHRRSGRAQAFVADVAIEAEVNAVFAHISEAFSAIDILVNNAALSRGDNIVTIDPETWDLNQQVVLKSVYLCSRAALPGMMAAGRGVILNIASVNGQMAIGEEPYSAAKAGVINLTQNMALRFGRYGVRVNAISPGSVQTPAWQQHIDRDPDILARIAKWYPLGRIGRPADIANAALFLVGDDAAWITGAILPVDGGLTAGNYGMFREIREDG